MSKRYYYSVRTGKNPQGHSLDLSMLNRLVKSIYRDFVHKDYLQEAMGFNCVDSGDVPGTMGTDLISYGLMKLRKLGLWPINKDVQYSEDDIFDLVEFLFDHISKPLDGFHHTWNDCGWHYETFDKQSGQSEFREAINNILQDYQAGWELSDNGEILSIADSGLDNLFTATLPSTDSKNVNDRVDAAILKFRRHRSSVAERKEAVRALADVLEFIRPEAKEVLKSMDESDLFNIANNFGIRHHNSSQKSDYDEAIWLSWMFYYYLTTIHAAI